MSIVYNGYIFDKDYSMLELKQIMDVFREIAKSYCEKAILQKTECFGYFFEGGYGRGSSVRPSR